VCSDCSPSHSDCSPSHEDCAPFDKPKANRSTPDPQQMPPLTQNSHPFLCFNAVHNVSTMMLAGCQTRQAVTQWRARGCGCGQQPIATTTTHQASGCQHPVACGGRHAPDAQAEGAANSAHARTRQLEQNTRWQVDGEFSTLRPLPPNCNLDPPCTMPSTNCAF
jgi:hypothetical protein